MERTVVKSGDLYTVSDKYPAAEDGSVAVVTRKVTMADIDKLITEYSAELTHWQAIKESCENV